MIFSELVISLLAMPSDLFNSIFPGKGLEGFLCPTVGFIHTFFGIQLMSEYKISFTQHILDIKSSNLILISVKQDLTHWDQLLQWHLFDTSLL